VAGLREHNLRSFDSSRLNVALIVYKFFVVSQLPTSLAKGGEWKKQTV
jgi:hypothetical protein